MSVGRGRKALDVASPPTKPAIGTIEKARAHQRADSSSTRKSEAYREACEDIATWSYCRYM
jgi:hypothetical protein